MTLWLTRASVLAIHDEQLAEHGGAAGIRDEGFLENALGRPRNNEAYGEPDLADLAALYALRIARNTRSSTATSGRRMSRSKPSYA